MKNKEEKAKQQQKGLPTLSADLKYDKIDIIRFSKL